MRSAESLLLCSTEVGVEETLAVLAVVERTNPELVGPLECDVTEGNTTTNDVTLAEGDCLVPKDKVSLSGTLTSVVAFPAMTEDVDIIC